MVECLCGNKSSGGTGKRPPVNKAMALPQRPSRLLPYGTAALAVGIALLLTALGWRTLASTPEVLFLAAVLVSVWYGGIRPGLFAISLSVLALDYFFIPPLYALGIPRSELPWVGVFVAVAVLLSALNERRQQAEQALRTLNADLERRVAERTAALQHANAELQQFASVVSHDLRQPLFIVAGALEFLGKHLEGKLDAKAQRFLDLADKGTRQVEAMLADLLTYARVGAPGQSLMPLESAAVWQQTLQTFRSQIVDCQALITSDPLPRVSGNGLRLSLLFQNLLSNALKFRGPEPPRIHVRAQRQGPEWVFAVRDNGIGIEAQHAERIFELFQRGPTHEESPGTGLGLAICKKIVEQHGGRLWVESQPGQGATFFFTLPAG